MFQCANLGPVKVVVFHHILIVLRLYIILFLQHIQAEILNKGKIVYKAKNVFYCDYSSVNWFII